MGGLLSGKYSNSGKRPAAKDPAPTTGDTTTPVPDTTSPVPVSDRVPVGVNIESLSDFSRLQPFVDMMKSARVWGSASAPWDATVPTDAQGWPTTDAGVVVAIVTRDPGDDASTYKYLTPGTYALRFTGKATVAPVASSASIANYAYDQTTNRSTADVVIGADATQLMLSFRDTIGGVKDVSLRRPGYPDTQTFTNEFIQAAAPFGVFRLMDFLATNGNPTRTWAERTTPASGSQTSAKGAAYEHAIQMANELGKDIWITIPAGADDDFIRQLATLLKNTLAPGRVVYVEYSNELWNFIFSQTTVNMNAAVAESVAGDLSLTDGTPCTQAMYDAGTEPCNKYWSGFKRVGKRTAQISKFFKEVMGADAFNTRFRIVYSHQWANRGISTETLKYMAKYHGPVSTLVYGIAGAPYIGLPESIFTSETATVDTLLSSLEQDVTGNYYTAFKEGTPYTGANWTQPTQKALANYYGVKSMAYEGGNDMGQANANLTNKLLASKDPRMGTLTKNYLDQWFGCGNDVFMYFSLTSQWDRWGYWGLTNNPADLSGSKYTVAKEVAQSARSTLTTCR